MRRMERHPYLDGRGYFFVKTRGKGRMSVQELEADCRDLLRGPENVYWERMVRLLTGFAPKRKPKNEKSRRGLHYKCVQELGVRLVKNYPMGKDTLEFVRDNFAGTPAGNVAIKQLRKIEIIEKKDKHRT